MYFARHDKNRNLLVCRLAAGGDETADFPQHLERMIEACEETARGKPKAAVLVQFDKGHEVPSALMRKRVAEVTGRPEFVLHLAIVTQNPMIRGVLTALSWLRRPHFDIKLVSNVPKAIAWLQELRGESLPELSGMMDAVNHELLESNLDDVRSRVGTATNEHHR